MADKNWTVTGPMGGAIAAAMLTLSSGVAAENAKPGKVIEEIIVTATYRDTSLMETPVSISAVTDELMEDLGAQSMEDIFTMVPGLNMVGSTTGANRYTIRGVTSQSGGLGYAPVGATVGVYLDGTPVTAALGPNAQVSGNVFDIERVEVLKGPQGTLFGEGSQGGTIRYLYKQPDASGFDAAMNVSAANMEESDDISNRLDGMVNLPLGDNLALRLTAWRSETAGFIDNLQPLEPDFNTQEAIGGRAALRFEGESLTVTGSLYHNKQATKGSSGTFQAYEALNRRIPGNPAKSDDTGDIYSLVVEKDFGWGTLTSLTSYTNRDIIAVNETSSSGVFFNDIYYGGSTLAANHPDCIPEKTYGLCPGWIGIFNLAGPVTIPDGNNLQAISSFGIRDSKRTVQEFRLVSASDERLRWTVGAFWKDSEESINNTTTATFFPGREAFAALMLPLLADNPANVHTDSIKELAVFGEVSYGLTDTLEVTAGVRVSNLKQHFSVTGTGTDDTPVSPKLVLAWQPLDDLLLYASYTTGFRPGNVNNGLEYDANNLETLGLNDRAATARQFLYFQGDKLDSYELGVKSTMWNSRVALMGSVYFIDWKDMIGYESNPALTGGFGYYNVNSGGAELHGVELELNAFVTDRLNIRLAGDINDSKVTRASAVANGAVGNELVYAPGHSASVAVNYTLPVWNGWTLDFYVDRAWVGKQFADSQNSQEIAAYDRSNGRVTLRSADQKWRVALFGTNLENKEIMRDRTLNGQYWHSPRQIGLEFGYKL